MQTSTFLGQSLNRSTPSQPKQGPRAAPVQAFFKKAEKNVKQAQKEIKQAAPTNATQVLRRRYQRTNLIAFDQRRVAGRSIYIFWQLTDNQWINPPRSVRRAGHCRGLVIDVYSSFAATQAVRKAKQVAGQTQKKAQKAEPKEAKQVLSIGTLLPPCGFGSPSRVACGPFLMPNGLQTEAVSPRKYTIIRILRPWYSYGLCETHRRYRLGPSHRIL